MVYLALMYILAPDIKILLGLKYFRE